MFSQLMSDCRRNGTRRFAKPANQFAAEPVRPQIRQHFAGQYSVIQKAGLLNVGNSGLRSEESPYPLRS